MYGVFVLLVCFTNAIYCTSAKESGQIDLRIIKGTETKKNAYPFVVSVREKYEGEALHNCGGSLLNSRTVLTAAHCIYYPKKNVDFKTEQLVVVLGDHDRYKTEGTEVYHDVKKVIIHEVYSKTAAYHDSDLALLILKESVTYTPAIQPICLNEETNLINSKPTVAGWGYTLDGMLSDFLQEIQVPILEDSWCSVYRKNYVAENMLCAGYPLEPVNHKDICHSDSGGPLFTTEEKPSQVGIVSFTSGLGCSRKGYPSVYTKISSFIDWISSHAEGEVCVTR